MNQLIDQIMEHVDAACPDYINAEEWHAGIESSMQGYDVNLLQQILEEWESRLTEK